MRKASSLNLLLRLLHQRKPYLCICGTMDMLLGQPYPGSYQVLIVTISIQLTRISNSKYRSRFDNLTELAIVTCTVTAVYSRSSTNHFKMMNCVRPMSFRRLCILICLFGFSLIGSIAQLCVLWMWRHSGKEVGHLVIVDESWLDQFSTDFVHSPQRK